MASRPARSSPMGTPGQPERDRSTERNQPGSRHRPWRVEGIPDDHPLHPDNAPGGDRKKEGFWASTPSWVRWLLVVLLVANWIAMTSLLSPRQQTEIPYSLFLKQVQTNNVSEITAVEQQITGSFKRQVTYTPDQGDKLQVTDFKTQRPVFAEDDIVGRLVAKGVTVQAEPQVAPVWQQVLLGFGPTLLFIALLVWFLRRSAQMAGGGGLSLLGRSKAKLYRPESGPRTTFADVAGIDEVKEEVM